MMDCSREGNAASYQGTVQSIPIRLPTCPPPCPPTCGVNRGKVQWGLGLPADGPSYGEVLTLVWMPERYVPVPYQGQTKQLESTHHGIINAYLLMNYTIFRFANFIDIYGRVLRHHL